jgi:hypothetical protein
MRRRIAFGQRWRFVFGMRGRRRAPGLLDRFEWRQMKRLRDSEQV